MRRLLGLIVVVAAASLSIVSVAQATYPGKNGRLAMTAQVGTYEVDRNLLLTTINPDGSGRAVLASDRSGGGRWSPDGSKLAFLSDLLISCCHSSIDIEVVAADGTGRVLAFPGDFTVFQTPLWSPDGTKLLFTRSGRHTASRAFTMNPDGSSLTQVSSGAFFDDDSGLDDVALGWLPGGRVAFLRTEYTSTSGASVATLYSVNADGTDERPVSNLDRDGQTPLLSPDGRTLAFVENVGGAGAAADFEVIAMDFGGTNVRQLTHEGKGYPYLMSWSPDGTQLLAQRGRFGSTSLQRIQADGSGTYPVLEEEGFIQAVWSPDGRKLAVSLPSSGEDGYSDLDAWIVSVDGSSRTDITNTPSISESVDDWQAIPGPKRSDYKNTAKFCKAEQAFWGDQFASRYGGGKNAYGKCVSGK